MKNDISLKNLYLIFLKIGAILLGGGYVILPILTDELCKKRKLIEETELIDYFAMSQSLPGLIAANISVFTGYKIRGKLGAISAILGIITIPFITIVSLASILEIIVNNQYIKSTFWGIEFAVIALIILNLKEVWQKSHHDIFFYIIFFCSLISLLVLKLSPVNVIIIFTVIGITIKAINKRNYK